MVAKESAREAHRGSGYEMTFPNFERLISYPDPAYRKSVAPLLKSWFNYEICDEECGTRVYSPVGEAIDLHALYELIQSDPKKQYELYQCAMSLWR